MEINDKMFNFTNFQENANGNNEMVIRRWMIPSIDRDKQGQRVVISFSFTFIHIYEDASNVFYRLTYAL